MDCAIYLVVVRHQEATCGDRLCVHGAGVVGKRGLQIQLLNAFEVFKQRA